MVCAWHPVTESGVWLRKGIMHPSCPDAQHLQGAHSQALQAAGSTCSQAMDAGGKAQGFPCPEVRNGHSQAPSTGSWKLGLPGSGSRRCR